MGVGRVLSSAGRHAPIAGYNATDSQLGPQYEETLYNDNSRSRHFFRFPFALLIRFAQLAG